MKFLMGLFYDTIGKEDKAKEILGLYTLDAKKKYWKQVALLCAIIGVGLAFFTYGISLLLLFVSVRKMQLVWFKK